MLASLQDVENYTNIKEALEELRNVVESKSERRVKNVKKYLIIFSSLMLICLFQKKKKKI